MRENDQANKVLNTVIRTRRTTRNFKNTIPAEEEMKEILLSATFAPFGGATGIPLKEIRKIFTPIP